MTEVDLNKLDAEQLRSLVAQLMGSATEQEQQLQTLQQRTVSAEQRNRHLAALAQDMLKALETCNV